MTLIDYWRESYDWRAAEAKLNARRNFHALIEGRPVHFVHLGSRHSDSAPPLLLLHGWPYSFFTMLPLAEELASRGYEVIVPSLPGTAFSAAPIDRVRGLRAISKRINALMTDALGHQRYFIHGGDHGAVVADWLALDSPERIAGVHANMIGFRHAGAEYGSGEVGVSDATSEEVAYVKAEQKRVEKESAYFKLQLTRSETIAYALADSPVGWAAYMLDKWQKWTDTRQRSFSDTYSMDRLLTEVMIYLVTECVPTSLWAYAGFATEPFGLQPGQTIDVPFGYSSFADPLLPRIPRHFVERSRTRIRSWREHATGGHFPMLEQSSALANDISETVKLTNRTP
jgi:pimeloyl-ACP methyl ester carboxylesterase